VHNDGRGRMRRLSGGAVPDRATQIVTELEATGGGMWTVSLSIDGEPRGALDGVPVLFGIAPFEGIDIGIDRRSPVSWELYERFGPFPWTGSLHHLAIEPGEPATDSPAALFDMLKQMGAKVE